MRAIIRADLSLLIRPLPAHMNIDIRDTANLQRRMFHNPCSHGNYNHNDKTLPVKSTPGDTLFINSWLPWNLSFLYYPLITQELQNTFHVMCNTDFFSLSIYSAATVINNVILHSFPISEGQMCNYIVASSRVWARLVKHVNSLKHDSIKHLANQFKSDNLNA